MPCCLRLLAIRVAPSTSLIVSPARDLLIFGREIMHRWQGRERTQLSEVLCSRAMGAGAITPEVSNAMPREMATTLSPTLPVLIGMGAIAMNGAHIGRGSVVGAGAVITEGKQFGENSLIIGAPARVIRTLEPDQAEKMGRAAQS